MKLIAVLFFSLLIVGSFAEEEDVGWNPEIPDCSQKPADVECVPGSSYRAGNACTDHCLKELMDCHPRMFCGCYCDNNLRKVDGQCLPKCRCPKFE